MPVPQRRYSTETLKYIAVESRKKRGKKRRGLTSPLFFSLRATRDAAPHAGRVRQQKGYRFHSVAAAKAALMYGSSDFDPGLFGPFGDPRVYGSLRKKTER